MIIVEAALEFGSEKDRDEAVALTADVQRDPGGRARLSRLLFCPRPRNPDTHASL